MIIENLTGNSYTRGVTNQSSCSTSGNEWLLMYSTSDDMLCSSTTQCELPILTTLLISLLMISQIYDTNLCFPIKVTTIVQTSKCTGKSNSSFWVHIFTTTCIIIQQCVYNAYNNADHSDGNLQTGPRNSN